MRECAVCVRDVRESGFYTESETLTEELKEQQKKELLEAFDKSKRSFEEVLDFMSGKADI